MTERFTPKEKPTDKPFEIRGHHLRQFFKFLRTDQSPESFAQTERNKYENKRESLFDIYSFPPDTDPVKMLAYYNDLLGSTSKETDTFENNLSEVFKNFKNLPDDATVRLTAGKPDEICKTCVGKEHCGLRNQEKFEGTNDTVRIDFKYVDIFLKASEERNIYRPFKHIREEVVFTDSPPIELSIYEMPIKEFKNTISYIQSHPDKYAELIGKDGKDK